MHAKIDLNALVGAIGDAVVVSDPDGKVIVWNPAAERLFGFSETEALGQSMDMIIPERLRKRHWEGFDKSMATGTTRYGHDVLRVPAVDKAGRALSIAFTVALLTAADGRVEGVAAVVRDDTARFNDDKALRRRLAELELAVRDTV